MTSVAGALEDDPAASARQLGPGRVETIAFCAIATGDLGGGTYWTLEPESYSASINVVAICPSLIAEPSAACLSLIIFRQTESQGRRRKAHFCDHGCTGSAGSVRQLEHSVPADEVWGDCLGE